MNAEVRSPCPGDGQSAGPNSWCPTQAQLFFALAIYFAVQLVVRKLISTSTHLDESEQLILTQTWALGYGPQPPLYTWIQKLFFSAFGVSILSLALVKNLLLFLIYALAYWNARFITRSHPCGLVAAASMVFIPQISWEAQRDLTHSVLACVFSLAALALFCRAVESRKPSDYLAFGICIGLGSLSKYNFLLSVGGLLLAALTLKNLRGAILNRKMLLAAVIGLLIFLPHGVWMVDHWQVASSSSSKFAVQNSGHWLGTTARGLANLLVASVGFVLPVVGILGFVFFRARPSPVEISSRADFVPLLTRMLAIIMTLVAVCVIFLHITNFRGRWFQAILVVVPILLATQVRSRLEASRLKLLVGCSLFVAGLVLILLPGRIVFGETLRHEEPLHFPYAALAAQMKDSLRPETVVVTQDHVLAGNLRLALQPRRVVTTESMDELRPDPQHLAFVWSLRKAETAPTALTDCAEKMGTVDWSQAKHVSADYLYYRRKRGTLAFVVMDRSQQPNR